MLFEILKQNQEELLEYTKEKLRKSGYQNMIATKEYVFAIGDIPVMLVAHLDTVHKTTPKNIFFDKKKKVAWSPERNRWR